MDKLQAVYISIGTATLSSIIAITVVLLTQWFLERRSRSELLRKKLEELYLLLVEIIALQSERYSLYLKYRDENRAELWNSNQDKIEQLYWKLGMYKNLYFRPLSKLYLPCFHYQVSLNEIIYRLNHPEHDNPGHDEVCQRFTGVHHSLSDLRRYIDANSEELVRGIAKKPDEVKEMVEFLDDIHKN